MHDEMTYDVATDGPNEAKEVVPQCWAVAMDDQVPDPTRRWMPKKTDKR
jgi:hypothetical protein